MHQRVPILVYHHVYPDDEPSLAVTQAGRATGMIRLSEFRRQLAYIDDHGWEVVSTTQVVDWLAGRAPLAPKSLALHFDNGWLDAVTVSLPALHEHGMKATAYVITDGTAASSEGRTASVRTSTEGAVAKPFVTWEQVGELLDAGWEIGAHTATHPRLADVYDAQGADAVRQEIEGSNDAYRRHLGFVPGHFAYPSGSRSEQTDELLSGYYRSLRLWEFAYPPVWRFTDRTTRASGLQCQNIDSTVSFDDFTRVLEEAELER